MNLVKRLTIGAAVAVSFAATAIALPATAQAAVMQPKMNVCKTVA